MKIKVRPRPGALGELLKTKGMTQVDAASASRLDRKTLAKIERGEDVKLETLQNLATRLNVPNAHFLPPDPAANPTTTERVDYIDPFGSRVTLRTFDIEQLSRLLNPTSRIRAESGSPKRLISRGAPPSLHYNSACGGGGPALILGGG